MLQNRHIRIFLCGFFVLFALPGCASDHFFPKLKPLFVGLDESKVPVSAKMALAQAKVDFQLGREGKPPCHARYVTTVPYTHSKVFQGNGYQLTLVNKDLVRPQEHGPAIVLEPAITGGKPYRYDDIDRSSD